MYSTTKNAFAFIGSEISFQSVDLNLTQPFRTKHFASILRTFQTVAQKLVLCLCMHIWISNYPQGERKSVFLRRRFGVFGNSSLLFKFRLGRLQLCFWQLRILRYQQQAKLIIIYSGCLLFVAFKFFTFPSNSYTDHLTSTAYTLLNI